MVSWCEVCGKRRAISYPVNDGYGKISMRFSEQGSAELLCFGHEGKVVLQFGSTGVNALTKVPDVFQKAFSYGELHP